MRNDSAKEEDFFVNDQKLEEKKYTYYLSDGSVLENDNSAFIEPFKGSNKDVCAYSFYSSKTKKTKMFVLHSKHGLYDPNETYKKNSNEWSFKSCNKTVFDLYTMYLNPKKRSRFRLIAAQKNL
jgi:hypothetical protein